MDYISLRCPSYIYKLTRMLIGRGVWIRASPRPSILSTSVLISFLDPLSVKSAPPALAEAKYRVIANVVAEMTLLRTLLAELHCPIQ